MSPKTSALSSEQAQRALLLFYDLLPAEVWEGEKPSEARVEALTDELREDGPPEAQKFIEGLDETDDPEKLGEVARVLLSQFADNPTTRPLVETAIERTSQPHLMFIEPLILVGVLAVLSSCRLEEGKFSFDGRNVVELVKALPSGLLGAGDKA